MLSAASGTDTDSQRPAAHRERAPRSWRWILAVLVGQGVVLADVSVPIVRPVLGAMLLLGVPVLALCRGPLARLADPLVAFLYACGLTVLGVILGALAINSVVPWLGVSAPLGRPVLVLVSTVVDVVLVGRRSGVVLIAPGALRRGLRAAVRARVDPAIVLGVLAVVLAVAGAVRLNNGLGGAVAVGAHIAVVGALGAALLRRNRPSAQRVAVVYLCGLALLLGTSLRGWYITGHDIQNEYLAYLFTHSSEHWVMSAYPVPYNACLSVNMLPSVLVDYLGVGGVFVFKVVMQLLFALVPICVYAWSRRMLSPRMSTLSAAIFLFFPTFFTDMPYLVRQEVAYLFVALALLAATQRGWSVRVRQGAVFVFGVGVVLSHYSTTYVLVITLFLGMSGAAVGALLQAWRGRRFRVWAARARHARPKLPRRLRPQLVMLGPLVVLALTATAWAWSTPATHSAGHLADTVTKLTDSIIHGNASAGSSDLNHSLFGGSGPTPQQRFREYTDAALQTRDAANADQYVFPQPAGAIAHPRLADRDYVPLTGLGRTAQDLGIDVHGANAALKGFGGALFQLFLAIGLIALMLHARATRRLGREQFWLVLASVGALGAVVVVPGLSADYGVLRAFQQTLLFTAPLLAVGVVTATRRLGRIGMPLAAGLVLGVGLVLTGAQPALLGGYYATISQSNSGQYYDLLYADSPQIAATHWLAHAAGGEGLQTVAASDIVTITRLQQYLPRSVTVTNDFLPGLLRKGTYVFATRQTADEHQATVFYTGDLLTYDYPTNAVDGQLDVVYSTDGTRIYR